MSTQPRQEQREAEGSVVTGPSVLCCVLLVGLVLFGIALIAAGATVYMENDGYVGMRMDALKDMLVRWEKGCEDVMKTVADDILIGAEDNRKMHKSSPMTLSGTSHEVPELSDDNKVHVSFLTTQVPISLQDGDSIKVTAFKKHSTDTPIAVAEAIPLRQSVTIDAVCKCITVDCTCHAKDLCGSEMQFNGETTVCKKGEVCGTCSGNGFLKQVCLIGNLCDKTNQPTELSGCEFPFMQESHVYSPRPKNKIHVHLYDVNSPKIMRHVIMEGNDIKSPSSAQKESQSLGSKLFGAGIPVLVLSLIGLITLCACKGWWCFYREAHSHGAWYTEEEGLNEHAIPMHGLEGGAEQVHTQRYKPMMLSPVKH